MTTITRRMTITCPDWCEQEKFGRDPYINAQDRFIVDHGGPKFGSFIYASAEQVDDVLTTTVTVSDLDGRDMSPAALRQLASHALAAAEWLEAKQ